MFGTYNVTLDNGEHHEVTADNRDYIAFRRRGFRDLGYESPDPLTQRMTEVGGNEAAQGLEMLEFIAWLVWHAGERIGAWSCDFETFTESECVGFELVGGDTGADVAADPTQAASGAPLAS